MRLLLAPEVAELLRVSRNRVYEMARLSSSPVSTWDGISASLKRRSSRGSRRVDHLWRPPLLLFPPPGPRAKNMWER